MVPAVEHVPLISVEALAKSFGAVHALRGVSLELRQGHVHGVVGANGSGKSTLLNCLGGVLQPDSGTIRIDGERVVVASPRHASDLGISFIHQELALFHDLSTRQNLVVGDRAETRQGLFDGRRRAREVSAVTTLLGLDFDLEVPLRKLTSAQRGLVEIARALMRKARFIAMDEPTAALSDVECERLFKVVRGLAQQGVAVAYVSHRLDEIEDLCD